MSAAHLVPCPTPALCGVQKGHEPGSKELSICLARQAGPARATATGFSTVTSLAGRRDDIDYNDPTSFHGTYLGDVQDMDSDDPTERRLSVDLEFGDQSLTVEGFRWPADGDDDKIRPETVLSQVGLDIMPLRYVHAEFLPDGERLEELDGKLRSLFGRDYEQIMDRAMADDQARQYEPLQDVLSGVGGGEPVTASDLSDFTSGRPKRRY